MALPVWHSSAPSPRSTKHSSARSPPGLRSTGAAKRNKLPRSRNVTRVCIYPNRPAADAAGHATVFAYDLDFHYICYTLEGAYMVTPNPKVQNGYMPVYLPSILISDAFGSMGNLTFYHKNGQCYTRRRSKASYPGTAAQLNHLAVHRRALQAWASLSHSAQLTWNTYETTAEPHRPPFDHKAHISGNNLFVSAYHGFALLGNEHIPEPQPFVKFPPFAVIIQSASDIDGVLQIIANTSVSEYDNPERYRLYIRLSLSAPGTGYSLRGMKGFVADQDCSGNIVISVPDYKEIWYLDLHEYQIHSRCVLLDVLTGYRSQAQRHSAILRLQD